MDLDLLATKLEFYGMKAEELCSKLKGIEHSWRSELEPVVFGHIPEFRNVYREIASMLEC